MAFFKRTLLAIGLTLAACAASASTWQSLGRVNALTALPDVANCQQRIINHYWSSKPAYTPAVINTYSPDNIQFVFPVDIHSLRYLTSNSVANSRFLTAVTKYNSLTGAKSIWGAVSVGQYPRVSIEVSYADANGLVQGLGWGVVASELTYYELQQSCPQ